jgi:hypothetical protein
VQGLLTNTVDLFTDQPNLVPQYNLTPLGIFAAQRIPTYKDVPTLKEAGFDLEFSIWNSMFAPKGTPEPILAKAGERLPHHAYRCNCRGCAGKAASTHCLPRQEGCDSFHRKRIREERQADQRRGIEPQVSCGPPARRSSAMRYGGLLPSESSARMALKKKIAAWRKLEMKRLLALALLFGSAVVLAPLSAYATYPDRPVTAIVPFPGGRRDGPRGPRHAGSFLARHRTATRGQERERRRRDPSAPRRLLQPRPMATRSWSRRAGRRQPSHTA